MHGDLRPHDIFPQFAHVDGRQGRPHSTIPVILRSYIRGFNIVGNVFGQPGYHTQYQAYATSTSGGKVDLLKTGAFTAWDGGNGDANCSGLPPAIQEYSAR